MLMSRVPHPEGQQAFFFVVPLEMEGRWRLLREGEAFDPVWSTIIDFEAGNATVRRFYRGDGGTEIFEQQGSYRVEGGRLIVDLESDDDGEHEYIVGAAPVDPDLIEAMKVFWHDNYADKIDRDRRMLIREELAEAFRTVGADTSGVTLSKVH